MINILCPPQQLKLGRKGENGFRTIEFDVAPWLADYPNGSISVVYMRPDGVVYPPEVSTANGVTSWVITSIDTAAAGAGYAEIRLIDGDVVGKSARINTMVYLAVNGTEIAPPAPDWTVVAAQIMAMIGNLDDLTTEDKSNLVAAINEAAQSGGGSGTGDHRDLTHRDANDQHPMSAITGLVAALGAKGTYSKPSGGIPYADLAAAVKASLDKADSALQQHQSLAAYRTASAQDVIDAGKLSTSGGTMTGTLAMGNNKISFADITDIVYDGDEEKLKVMTGNQLDVLQVDAPVDDDDAVNKGYADSNYAQKSDLSELQTGVVACLNDINALLAKAVFTEDVTALMAQLAADIANLVGGEPIEIAYEGTTAVISGLNSLNITYSGTTAEIGGE